MPVTSPFQTPLRLLALAALTLGTALVLTAEPTPSTPGKPTAAPQEPLAPGTPAPAFKPTAWLQGDPVTGFENGKVYLVEFWATWCGPCIKMIPHLDALQKKYADKGLVVIGTNVADKDRATAENFVAKRKGDMTYRIAYDAKDGGLVTRDWLDAGNVGGIPYAYVVRDGIILWRGNPARLSETTLEQMLDGKYDVAAAVSAQKKAEEQKASTQKAHRERLVSAKKAADEAIAAKDEPLAVKKIAEYSALLSPSTRPMESLLMKLRLYSATGDTARATAEADAFFAANKDKRQQLINLIAALVRNKELVENKQGAALIAKLADVVIADQSLGKTPSGIIVATQARYEIGDKAGALTALKNMENVPNVPKELSDYIQKLTTTIETGAEWPSN